MISCKQDGRLVNINNKVVYFTSDKEQKSKLIVVLQYMFKFASHELWKYQLTCNSQCQYFVYMIRNPRDSITG